MKLMFPIVAYIYGFIAPTPGCAIDNDVLITKILNFKALQRVVAAKRVHGSSHGRSNTAIVTKNATKNS